MSILKDIYNEDYSIRKPLEEMPVDLYAKQKEFFDAVEHTMGSAFIEQHWENLEKARNFCDFHYFREGFRLGVALILEAR